MVQSLRDSDAYMSMVDIYSKMVDPPKITPTKTLPPEAEEDEDNQDEEAKEDEENADEEALNSNSNNAIQESFTFDLSEGTLADTSYPVLNHFKIPIDNHDTLIRLHAEVTKALQVLQKKKASQERISGNKAIDKGGFCDAIQYKDPTSNRQYTHVMVPKGRSKPTIVALRRTIAAMTEYCIDPKEEEDEEGQHCISQVIGQLEKNYPDSYLDLCVLKGYSTRKAGKMSAEYWNAMAEDANLLITQQKIINRYLVHHFGAPVRVSENELRKMANEYVPFVTFEKMVANKKVMYSYRDASVLFSFYADHLLEYLSVRPVDRIEVSVGDERGSDKKEERERKRAAIESAEMENPMVARVLPRDLCKEEAKLAMDGENDG